MGQPLHNSEKSVSAHHIIVAARVAGLYTRKVSGGGGGGIIFVYADITRTSHVVLCTIIILRLPSWGALSPFNGTPFNFANRESNTPHRHKGKGKQEASWVVIKWARVGVG